MILMILTLIAVNALAWAALQLSIAAIAVRISPTYFADRPFYRIYAWEINFYRKWLQIRRWKGLLPDGASWVGGAFRKKRIEGRNPNYLRQLALETRRGEVAHWLMLACFPLFFPRNPPLARLVIALYAIAANLPCIIVQRYNRQMVQALLSHQGPLQQQQKRHESPLDSQEPMAEGPTHRSSR